MRSYRPPTGHKWSDLQEKPNELPAAEIEADRVLAEQISEEAMELLHRLTTWKRNLASDSDGALRELEAQRRFIAILEARRARHRERYAAASKESDGGRDGTRRRERDAE